MEELTELLKEDVIFVQEEVNSNSTGLALAKDQDIVLMEGAVAREIGELACRVVTSQNG